MDWNRPATPRARLLRRTPTDAERRLWPWLRAHRFNGAKFRRQHPVGRYFADFAAPHLKLIIELDGGGHTDPEQAAHDTRRDAYLQSLGWKILRFWNHDVLFHLDVVLETIRSAVEGRLPSPLPLSPGGEG
ncbi:MAG: hypothetical protein AMXMBFR34_48500 [Myxococcaceae bacterium]